jgi:hypothetical protein
MIEAGVHGFDLAQETLDISAELLVVVSVEDLHV